MKNSILALALLLSSATMMAENEPALVVNYGEEEEATIFLSTNPIITIANGNLVITPALGEEIQIPMSTSLTYRVEMRDNTLVGIDAHTGVAISRTGNTITVHGAKSIELYDTAGQKLLSGQGSANIDLQRFATATLVLKVNNRTYKIAAK